jgi:formate/nitrite transporter FocA (FNT family)
MYSILAGIMISLGCIINLQVGGIVGALLFSIGLITILMFNFDLFTGRAGLIPSGQITWKKLGLIWLGNLYGCLMVAAAMSLTPLGVALGATAQAIVATRIANGVLANVILGGCCGILMYIGVGLFTKQNNPIYAAMPVATFILSGYNHCVADMFYLTIANSPWIAWGTLIPTTIGNILGCCLIPFIQNYYKKYFPWKN